MENKKETFASDTSGRTAADWAKALSILLAGLAVAHLGVTLFLLSELGTDTFTVFIQGLSRLSGLTVGTVQVIVLCILMILMLLGTKGYVKPGTVVCAFCGGPNDLVAVILSDRLPSDQFRWVRVGCDLFFVVLGFLLGGTVGAGTVAAVFLTGPLVQFWLPRTKKPVQAILHEDF